MARGLMPMDDELGRRQIRRREEDVVVLDRLDRLEADVDRRFDRLDSSLSTATRTFTLEQIEKLDTRYLNRRDASIEYVPRVEHEHRRDWTIRVLLAIVAIGSVVEPIVLKAAG